METIKTLDERIEAAKSASITVAEQLAMSRQEVDDLRAAMASQAEIEYERGFNDGQEKTDVFRQRALKAESALAQSDASVGVVPSKLVPDTACKQGKCANVTTGCWGKCHLQEPGYVVIAHPAAAKVALPEFSRDPDGDLALDWVVGDASLSMSFSKAGVVSWATNVAGKSECGAQQVANSSPTAADACSMFAGLQATAAALQKFKADWMRVPYFADRVNQTIREAIRMAINPLVNLDVVGGPLDLSKYAISTAPLAVDMAAQDSGRESEHHEPTHANHPGHHDGMTCEHAAQVIVDLIESQYPGRSVRFKDVIDALVRDRQQDSGRDAAQLVALILKDPGGGTMHISSPIEMDGRDNSMRFTVTNPETGYRHGVVLGIAELTPASAMAVQQGETGGAA